MAVARRPRGATHWAWDEDELTQDIVRRLQSGEGLETRQFLKPIFRYKLPSSGPRRRRVFLFTLVAARPVGG